MSATTRPTPVTIAVALLWIGAVVAAILAVVFFIAAGNETELAKTAAAKGQEVSALKGVVTSLAVASLVAAVIDLIFALRLGKGGRTARLIFTILSVIAIIGNVMTGAQGGQTLHWISALISVVILILLWVPKASQDFFNRTAG